MSDSLSQLLLLSRDSIDIDPTLIRQFSHYKSIFIQCLCVYESIHFMTETTKLFTEAVIRPFLLQLSHHNKSGEMALSEVYQKMLAFTQNDCLAILEASATIVDEGSSFDFRLCLLQHFLEHIAMTGSSHFNPGLIQGFHTNYLQTIDFIASFERISGLEKSAIVRKQGFLIDFMKKWQIQVYFTIVSAQSNAMLDNLFVSMTQTASKMENQTTTYPSIEPASITERLSQSMSQTASSAGVPLIRLEQNMSGPHFTRDYYEWIQRIWDASLYIPTLMDKFMLLYFEVL